MQAMDCLTTSQIQRYIHSGKKTTEAGTILRQPLLLVMACLICAHAARSSPGMSFVPGRRVPVLRRSFNCSISGGLSPGNMALSVNSADP